MTNIEKYGKVYSNGVLLQQYDEHSEDESISGNSDRADNLLTIAEFRDKNDCELVAKILNQYINHENK